MAKKFNRISVSVALLSCGFLVANSFAAGNKGELPVGGNKGGKVGEVVPGARMKDGEVLLPKSAEEAARVGHGAEGPGAPKAEVYSEGAADPNFYREPITGLFKVENGRIIKLEEGDARNKAAEGKVAGIFKSGGVAERLAKSVAGTEGGANDIVALMKTFAKDVTATKEGAAKIEELSKPSEKNTEILNSLAHEIELSRLENGGKLTYEEYTRVMDSFQEMLGLKESPLSETAIKNMQAIRKAVLPAAREVVNNPTARQAVSDKLQARNKELAAKIKTLAKDSPERQELEMEQKSITTAQAQLRETPPRVHEETLDVLLSTDPGILEVANRLGIKKEDIANSKEMRKAKCCVTGSCALRIKSLVQGL